MHTFNGSLMISNANILINGGQIIQYHVHVKRSVFELLQSATSPAAFHDSGERYDPPRCHRNTRIALMKFITDWTLGLDKHNQGKFIMWLTGAAGAGKSATLQSFAEQQDLEGCLLASFFFGKSDPDRNHSRKFVATIAYQIHKKIPKVRPYILTAIEEDPLIFTKSLFAQFMVLIIQPLQAALLLESRFFDQPGAPRVIVVDGLDECIDRREQKDVLLTISRITRRHQLPVLFLISSRPGHDIVTTFSSSQLRTWSTRLDLDERFFPEWDIELYLLHEFKGIKDHHPFRHSIPSSWPTDRDVMDLVWKSSGQFIYAVTVIKFVGSSRHHPHHRLAAVLDLRRPSRPEDHPFAELDALYMNILSSLTEDSIWIVLHVLSFVFHSPDACVSVDNITAILQLDDGAIDVAFYDLGALVSIVTDPSDRTRKVKILHASLRDFLLDPVRSQTFYMRYDYLQKNAISCLRMISLGQHKHVVEDALLFFARNCKYLKITSALLDELQSFPISRCYYDESQPAVMFYLKFHNIFLPEVFEILDKSDREDAKCLYRSYVRLFKTAFVSYLIGLDVFHSKSSSKSRFALDFALLCHYPISLKYVRYNNQKSPSIPPASLMAEFRLYDRPSPQSNHPPELQPPWIYEFIYVFDGYIQFLSRISPLGDPEDLLTEGNLLVSEDLHRTFSNEIYAAAARSSLEFLCGIADCDSLVSKYQRFNLYFSSLRRTSPWKWRRYFGKGGSCRARKQYRLIKPLEYINQENSFTQLSKRCIMRKRRSKPIYFHAYFPAPDHFSDDLIVLDRVQSEKYLLALGYLIFFLPMAGESEHLLHLCETKVFSQRCCEYPKRTKEARRAIDNYLTRMKMCVRMSNSGHIENASKCQMG